MGPGLPRVVDRLRPVAAGRGKGEVVRELAQVGFGMTA